MSHCAFKFLDTKEQIIFDLTYSTPQRITKKSLAPAKEESYHFFKKLGTIPDFLQDTPKINTLQSNITKALTEHSQNDLLPVELPLDINVKFVHTNKIVQLYNYFQLREETAYAINHKTPTIYISGDILKEFDPNYIKEFFLDYPEHSDFLNHCRLNFFNKGDFPVTKIITEMAFLHELGHIVCNEKLKTSLHSSYLKETHNHYHEMALAEIISNLEEGFSDCFGTYLTSQRYPQFSIIQRQHVIRKQTLQDYDDIINPYDIDNIFSPLSRMKDINSKNIADSCMDIAMDNTLIHVKKQLFHYFSLVEQQPILAELNTDTINKLYQTKKKNNNAFNLNEKDIKSIKFHNSLKETLISIFSSESYQTIYLTDPNGNKELNKPKVRFTNVYDFIAALKKTLSPIKNKNLTQFSDLKQNFKLHP